MTDAVSTLLSARPARWLSPGRLRLALFVAIAACMIAGPVIEQVFGNRSPLLRSWTMFSGIGIGLIDISFATRSPDGTLVPLDRFETLRVPRDGKLRRIEDLNELASIVVDLCTALGLGADLRVKGRQAQRHGWQVFITDEKNVCEAF
jgi:hypothetical protein